MLRAEAGMSASLMFRESVAAESSPSAGWREVYNEMGVSAAVESQRE